MSVSTLARPPEESAARTHSTQPAKRPKTTGRDILLALLGRVLNPLDLFRALRLQWNRKAHKHAYDDAQLALYSKILPGDFLHFGYFDQPDVPPEEMRLADITRAQQRYADLLIERVGNPNQPVLDVGCGMGGLSRMLLARGYTPVALTPDRLQVTHIKATIPIDVIAKKFERLDPAGYLRRFGTIYTSESLQYLKLDQSLPILESILAPGGQWIVCDYFRLQRSSDRSCHVWSEFTEKVAAAGWKISLERDITPHVLPTLAYINMWASRFGVPFMQFGFLRLRRKNPGLHHLAARALASLENLVRENIAVIDPECFAREKRYMLLVLERA